jgi:Zn-finger nucleic acid-binding protein
MRDRLAVYGQPSPACPSFWLWQGDIQKLALRRREPNRHLG